MKQGLFFARIPDPEHPHDTILFLNTASRVKILANPASRVAVKSRMPFRDFPHSNLVELPYPENSLPDTGHSVESKWPEMILSNPVFMIAGFAVTSVKIVIVRWKTLLPRYKSRIPNSLKCLWLFLCRNIQKKLAAASSILTRFRQFWTNFQFPTLWKRNKLKNKKFEFAINNDNQSRLSWNGRFIYLGSLWIIYSPALYITTELRPITKT